NCRSKLRVTKSSNIISRKDKLKLNIIEFVPCICGGKGGFGSLLKSIGSQIGKTKNKNLCRDLNGQRIHERDKQKRAAEYLESKKKTSAGSTINSNIGDKEDNQSDRIEVIEKKLDRIVNGGSGVESKLNDYYQEKEIIIEKTLNAIQDGISNQKSDKQSIEQNELAKYFSNPESKQINRNHDLFNDLDIESSDSSESLKK
ncbi:MAG: hypothetical protein MHMPM18_004450, partial [Marteilia pararefringens]